MVLDKKRKFVNVPIHLRGNQYKGLNAHLQSYLQHEAGGWASFHAEHIADLRRIINQLLPTGYFVRSEKSLQISEQQEPASRVYSSRSKPDVVIYQSDLTESIARSIEPTKSPTATLAVIDTLSDLDYLNSVVISIEEDGELVPVTRIELLSPANKRGGSYHDVYLSRRDETLVTGIRLVEIDYLHESHPVLSILPSYPDDEAGAYPYMILVSDPRPTLETGQTAVFGFRVDQAMPTISVPLADGDAIPVDFGGAYNVTFEGNNFYGDYAVDYDQLPLNFDRYHPDDQARIRERMAAIQNTTH